MENLLIAKPLVRQIAKMPLNTAKLVCTLLIAREKDETEMCFSVNRLVTLASGSNGGNTIRVFLPALQSLSDNTFMTVDIKAKDLLDSKESEDPEKVIRVSGPLISASICNLEDGEVTVKINPDFFPVLDCVKGNWVALDLETLRKIRGDYELKLYGWLLTHLGGHEHFEFDWHLFGSGEKEESVMEYFDLESKKGFRTPSDIKVRIFERYLPKLQALLADTLDLQWSYIEKKRAYPRAHERAKFTESIRISVTRKDTQKETEKDVRKEEKTIKKERPNQDVGEGKSPNSRLVRPALNQQKNTTETDKCKPEKITQPKKVSTDHTGKKASVVTTEIKTITDFYNEAIQAKAGSDQEYSYSTISRYASPLLQNGWSVDRICSLIEANRAYYTTVKHPEHIKKPQLVFNIQEERLDKIRPFLKPMTEILVEKYCQGGLQNGAICHIPASKFWLLDYETQAIWLDTTPYESMPEDIQAEFDRRNPDWKEIMTLYQDMPWTSSTDTPYR